MFDCRWGTTFEHSVGLKIIYYKSELMGVSFSHSYAGGASVHLQLLSFELPYNKLRLSALWANL